jgi:hypothetical protein
MSRFTRKRNAYWVAAAALCLLPINARSAGDIQFPEGYRSWRHVNTMIVTKDSPLFEAIGGMHIIHVNPDGEAALKTNGPYPDKTVFVSDLHDFTLKDGSYSEGALKGVSLMVKDSKLYASTGGWGFEFFVDGDSNKRLVTNPTKQCFECHQAVKNQDYVYSTYIR